MFYIAIVLLFFSLLFYVVIATEYVSHFNNLRGYEKKVAKCKRMGVLRQVKKKRTAAVLGVDVTSEER